MATQAKKEETKKEEPKKTLQKSLDEITFRNASINKLKAAQDEKMQLRLREQMGRKKRERAATPYAGVKGLQGLQGLRGNLGGQFRKASEE